MTSADRGAVFQQIGRLYRDGTLSGLTDAQLLERYLTQRDEVAFEALVKLHGPMVLGLCRRVLRDPRDIEDAFQATFLVLVRKATTIRDRGRLSNWLYGVAYRVAKRARHNTLRRRGREISVDDIEASAAPEPANSSGLGSVLDEELNRLPRKYRSPLILCYLDGRTHDQAAEELGCPVGTIRSRLARGRDLLRRRLTSRGHASMAAVLGSEAPLAARILSEGVPPALVSTTVKGLVGIGAYKTIQVSAAGASVSALTQGVLTTMKLAQLKWIGLALATTLSAGGVIAVSYGARDALKAAPNAGGVVEKAGAAQEKALVAPVNDAMARPPAVDERLKAVEQKLDELLSRSPRNIKAGATGTTSREGSSSGTRDPFETADDGRRIVEPGQRSIPELEAALEVALRDAAWFEPLIRTGNLPGRDYEKDRLEYNKARARVSLSKAALEGLLDDLSDEIDRLKLQTKRKQAEREKSKAQGEAAAFVIARNTRLNERKPGMVSAEDVARAEFEMKSASAQVAVVDVEIAEIELRVQQLERRCTRIREILKLAKGVK